MTVPSLVLELRENIPEKTWEWPDGTFETLNARIVDVPILFGNDGVDKVQQPPRPYSHLYKDGQYIPFSFTVGVPLEYKDENGAWVEFMNLTENTHEAIYTALGACSWKVTADNWIESDPEGPWKDDEKEE